MEERKKLFEKIKKIYKKEGKVVIQAATGSGKTQITLNLIKDTTKETHILTPTTDIAKGWKDEIERWKMQHLLPYLKIYCYQSLHKNMKHGIDYVMDEAHRITYNRLSYLKAYLTPETKIIALSATIAKDKREILRELGLRAEHYVNFNTDQAVKAGFIVDYQMIVYTIPLGTEKRADLPRFKYPISETKAYEWLTSSINIAKRNMDWNKVSFLSIWRKQLLAGLPSKEIVAKEIIKRFPKDKRNLVFAANIKQSDRLCKYSYHSKSDKELLENYRKGNFNVLSSVGKLIEGINAPCDSLLKLGVDAKERNLIQVLGRSLRKDPNNPDKKAVAVVLVAENTQEEVWMRNTTANFKNLLIKKWEEKKKQNTTA